MRRVEWQAVALALALATVGVARAEAAPPGAPARSARLVAEVLTLGVGGVALPVGSYLAVTAGLQSFTGFFAGIAAATALGVVVAPVAVVLVGHLLGLSGGVGRAVAGALLGLAVGLLIGLPLATLPGAGYLLGLGLLWALPSAGALAGLEWGRADAAASGLTVARF